MNDTQILISDEVSNRNVSMHGRHWVIVDEVNARFAFGNVSAALRYIVSEYARLSQMETARLTD